MVKHLTADCEFEPKLLQLKLLKRGYIHKVLVLYSQEKILPCYQNMKIIASRLRMKIFKPERMKDLTKVDVQNVIKDAVAHIHENCTNIDRFMFMVSSHGREREHKGQKSHTFICRDDEKLFVDQDVIEKFSDTKGPGLEGKPKLLFIQACRGRLHCG